MKLGKTLFACALLVSVSAVSKAQTPALNCHLERLEHYQCNRQVFAKRLANAHAIRVDTGRMDLFAKERLANLVEKLGKQIAAPGQHADLVFEIDAVDQNGRINIGPNDMPLVRLNVYDPADGTAHHFLWVETLDGQPDMPWPGQVTELLKSFQQHIAGA